MGIKSAHEYEVLRAALMKYWGIVGFAFQCPVLLLMVIPPSTCWLLFAHLHSILTNLQAMLRVLETFRNHSS